FYVVDRKGDLENLTYGKPHRYSIPSFRRLGYGHVLGLPSDIKIDRLNSDDRGIVLIDSVRQGGLERRLLSKQRTSELPMLRIVKPSAVHGFDLGEHRLDYIPVRAMKKRKRDNESPDPSRGTFDFRTIEDTKAKVEHDLSDSDLEYMSDAAGSLLYQEFFQEAKEQNARLSKRVKQEPQNLNAWLELIEHQETMIRIGSTEVHRELTGSELKALASVRLDLYQQAAKVINSDRLKLGIMEESSKTMQRDDYSLQWKQLLERDPDNINLWVKYLDVLQTSLTEFRYENCRSKFLECLKILLKAYKTGVPSSNLEELRIYVFLRLTITTRESGYHERATALWQALLEYHILGPSDHGVENPESGDVRLKEFEEFWESECPRIGERDSLGWGNFKGSEGWLDPPEAPALGAEESQPSDVFEGFCKEEQRRTIALRWPGRTVDEAGEDDPYHVVLFADIEPELRLMQEISDHTLLAQAFLCYCHLPPLHDPRLSLTRKWWLDPFLRDETIQQSRMPCQSKDVSDDAQPRLNFVSNDSLTMPMKNLAITTESLYRGNLFQNCQDADEQRWLRRSLKCLAGVLAGDELAEYYLAWELHCNPQTAAKQAKALLKKRPSSLRLYNAYAITETRNGNSVSGDRAFTTAIGLSAQLPSEWRADLPLLWRTWVWEALRVGDVDTARTRIALIGATTPNPLTQLDPAIKGKTPLEPAAVLRVRRGLTEGRDHALSTGRPEHAIFYAECLCLLAYLQNNNDLSAALDVFRQTSALLESRELARSTANEMIHQARCQLLSWHMDHAKLFKPSVVRSELADSLQLFPNNTDFLSLFAVNEARFRIDDRVRAIVRDVVLRKEDQSVVGWLFSVYAEMKRGENLGGTRHAVRAAFERAVGSESCKHSLALWRSYVLYMCSTGDYAAAKPVFFRGLLHVPFSKAFVMLGFEGLRGVMTRRELEGLYTTMQEKELRLYIDLDEVLEKEDGAKRLA
ncbi:DUF1740-domain-containing protein, partial [Saccharata proteae CBS 121410]